MLLPRLEVELSEEEQQVNDYLVLRFTRQSKRDKLMQELLVGINESAQLMMQHRMRQNERSFVLSVAMALEGILTVLRQEILEEVRMGVTFEPFTISETVLLQGRSFDIKENGKVSIKPAKVPLKANTRFTLRCLQKAYGLAPDKIDDATSVTHLNDITTIRSRLVHPKSPDDLRISQEDIDCTRACASWLHELVAVAKEGVINLWKNMDREIHIPGRRELTFFEIGYDMTESDSI